MLLCDYRKLGDLSLADMRAKLRAVANPGELDKLTRATILRHETGASFPAARMQLLYELATDRAVMPADHVEAHKRFQAAKAKAEEGMTNAQT